MFKVHKADTSVRNVKPPMILVSEEAAKDMWAITDIVTDEVGWLGSVEYDREEHTFLITHIFLPRQEVNTSTTELDPEGIAEVMEELINQGDEGIALANSIRFWGHSHVSMGVSPSGQDNTELANLAKDTGDYFIAARTNKKGEIRFDMLTSEGWLYHDLPWNYESVHDPRYEQLQEMIKERVQRKVYGYQRGRHVQTPAGAKQGKGTAAAPATGSHLGGGYGGLWDEWDAYYQSQTADADLPDEDSHITLDSEGEILNVKVWIRRKGTLYSITITRKDILNANVNPDLFMWAPTDINLDDFYAVYLNRVGQPHRRHFKEIADIELDCLLAMFQTKPMKQFGVELGRMGAGA